MVDGFWTVEFEGIPNFLGGGVAVLTRNRLFGGDSQYYYTGLYDTKDGTITAMIQISSFVPAAVTVFGTNEKQFGLRLDGAVNEKLINATAVRSDHTSVRLRMTLTKRAELPV